MHSSWDSFWKTWWSAAFKVGLNSDGLLRLSRFSFFSFLLFFHPPVSRGTQIVRVAVSLQLSLSSRSLLGFYMRVLARVSLERRHLPFANCFRGAHVPRLNCCYGRRLLPAKSCKSCKKWALAPRPRLPVSGGARLRARVQVEIRLCR